MMLKRAVLTAITLALAAGPAWSKLPVPPMTEEQKAKAEEAKTKAAEAAKKTAELLGKYQDKAVANYKMGRGKTQGAMPAPAKAMK